jgi:hypothetical protein
MGPADRGDGEATRENCIEDAKLRRAIVRLVEQIAPDAA